MSARSRQIVIGVSSAALCLVFAGLVYLAPAPAARAAGDAEVGRPLEIKYTAVDGREVDLGGLKGKVVLIDFWATWCPPCVEEIPNVKRVYDRLHDKGFEIIGISLDEDRDELLNFIRERQMPWPQYFDGKGWENEFVGRFDLNAIPTMWLVDKQGRIADMNARRNLEKKVEELLGG